jgi:hypothetical protein
MVLFEGSRFPIESKEVADREIRVSNRGAEMSQRQFIAEPSQQYLVVEEQNDKLKIGAKLKQLGYTVSTLLLHNRDSHWPSADANGGKLVGHNSLRNAQASRPRIPRHHDRPEPIYEVL